MIQDDIQDDIKNFRIFENFRLEELDDVLGLSEEITFQSDEVIIEEAKEGPDSDLCIILKGRVKVQVELRKIQIDLVEQKRLAILKKGDIFGERGLLKGKHRSARVTAYGDGVTVLKINREKLFALFAKNPKLGYIFMRNLAVILSDRMVDLIFMWRDEM